MNYVKEVLMRHNGTTVDGIFLSVKYDSRSKAYILSYQFDSFTINTRYDMELVKDSQHYMRDAQDVENSIQEGIIYAQTLRKIHEKIVLTKPNR